MKSGYEVVYAAVAAAAFAALVPLSACTVESSSVRRVCLVDENATEKRAAFIIKCAEAANPRSDEEGEDLVAQCERTAERLYCRTVWAVPRCHQCSMIACEHAGPQGQHACRQAGWGKKP